MLNNRLEFAFKSRLTTTSAQHLGPMALRHELLNLQLSHNRATHLALHCSIKSSVETESLLD